MDAVAGATMTRDGLMEAVKNALTAAGADMEALSGVRAAAEMKEEEISADVVIVGAGNEGFNDAMVLEFTQKMEENTAWLMDMGYDAQPTVYTGWLPMEMGGNAEDVTKGLVLVHGELQKGVSKGNYIIDAMQAKAEKVGVEIMVDTGAIEILTDDTGAVVGAKAMGFATNTEYTIYASAVVIAAGNKDGNNGITGGTGYEITARRWRALPARKSAFTAKITPIASTSTARPAC